MAVSNRVCPLLLDAKKYDPDTLNLLEDKAARDYWLKCFEEMVQKFAKFAVKSSQIGDASVEERANSFCQDVMKQVEQITRQDCGDKLAIRDLLNLNEMCLRRHGFNDPWYNQKKLENATSIGLFKKRLNHLDNIHSPEEKWEQLVKGLLAGNMFDWGAQAVTEILEKDNSFGLEEALSRIQSRPWLVDGLDSWLERTQVSSNPHKCAAIFLDNSGADVVLGVLPFARELLLKKTKVLLCANSEPALNDITFKELEQVLDLCCKECDILATARNHKELLVLPNGQSGPCLDFRNLDPELCQAMTDNCTDLLIIEGMGRALHTNLNAKFKCETLKLAVIKNEWLANRLGGDVFSVICKYEKEPL